MIEPEAATAKIQHPSVRAVSPDFFRYDIQALPPMFFDVEQTCFPQDSEVLRNIVVCRAKAARNLADAKRRVH